jgi:hypothetical protein
MSVVITFVHGTRVFLEEKKYRLWEKRGNYDYGKWLDLETALSGSDVKIVHFPWSGRNSRWERSRVTERLTNYLRAALQEGASDDLHYVIAHSHGGNIATMAASDNQCKNNERLRGILCLATPFVFVSRNTPIVFPNAAISGWYWAMPFLIYALSRRLDIRLSFIIAVVVLASVARGFRTAAKVAKKVKDELPPPTLPSEKLWIIRHPVDEAVLLLSLGRGSAWLYYHMVAFMQKVNRFFGSLVGWSVIAISITIVAFHLAWPSHFGVLSQDIARYFFLVVLSIPVMSGVALSLAMVVVWLVCVWPLGIELGLAAPLVEIAIESSPEGSYNVTLLPLTEAMKVQHSESYNDKSAIAEIRRLIMADVTAARSCKQTNSPSQTSPSS